MSGIDYLYPSGTKARAVVDAALAGPVTVRMAADEAGCCHTYASVILRAAYGHGHLLREWSGTRLVYTVEGAGDG